MGQYRFCFLCIDLKVFGAASSSVCPKPRQHNTHRTSRQKAAAVSKAGGSSGRGTRGVGADIAKQRLFEARSSLSLSLVVFLFSSFLGSHAVTCVSPLHLPSLPLPIPALPTAWGSLAEQSAQALYFCDRQGISQTKHVSPAHGPFQSPCLASPLCSTPFYPLPCV